MEKSNENLSPALQKEVESIEKAGGIILEPEEKLQLGKLLQACSGLYSFIIDKVPPMGVYEAIDLYFKRYIQLPPKQREIKFPNHTNQLLFVVTYMFMGFTFKKSVENICELKGTWMNKQIQEFQAYDFHYQNYQDFRERLDNRKPPKPKN